MAKLLVVDDEKNLRLVIQRELTRQGHEAETAPDGQAAWELMEARDFDVLLCDINMPRLDGMGLLRRLKEKMPNAPEVIMLTGQGTVETATICCKANIPHKAQSGDKKAGYDTKERTEG